MTLYKLATSLRRRWLLVLTIPLLVALLSLGWQLTRPPRYESSARLIVTRGVTDPNSTAGITWAREDTVAQDLPTIISSAAFAQDVAAEINRRGIALDAGQLMGALRSANDGKIVTITATTGQPEAAPQIIDVAISELQQNGLRYWGDPTWTPQTPGVNIGPLDPPSAAVAVPSRREIAIDAALRAIVGLVVAIAIALGLEVLERRTNDVKQGSRVKGQGSGRE